MAPYLSHGPQTLHGPHTPCLPHNATPAIVGEAETGNVVDCCGDILLGGEVVNLDAVGATAALTGGEGDQMGSNWALRNMRGLWSAAAKPDWRFCRGGGLKRPLSPPPPPAPSNRGLVVAAATALAHHMPLALAQLEEAPPGKQVCTPARSLSAVNNAGWSVNRRNLRHSCPRAPRVGLPPPF